MSSERVGALRSAAATRSLDAEQRARKALAALDEHGQLITFKAVAARANVSRQFLYSHGGLRAEIDRLRGERARAPSRLPPRERASEDSLRARLRDALEENKRLRAELADLRQELAVAHGRVREVSGRAATPGERSRLLPRV